MTRKIKQVLSIVLTLCILASAFSVNCFAVYQKDAATDPNYTVLILDTVDKFVLRTNGKVIYTVPTSIELIKTAASAFVEQIFENSNNKNYVAIIGCGKTASLISGFSNDKNELLNAISAMKTTIYGSNFNQALLMADSLIEGTDAKNHKNIVMFMPEIPCYGEIKEEGNYSYEDCNWVNLDTGIHYYKYANVIYDTLTSLKEKYSIFTIGLFSLLEDVPVEGQPYLNFAKRCAEDFQNAGYFEANNPEEVRNEFENVANFIVEEQSDNNPGFLDSIRDFILRIWDFIKSFFGM